MIASRPLFYLQIVDSENHVVVRIPGGRDLETDLINLIVEHVMDRGVSFKTQAHVEQDVREGVKAAILSLKDQTRFVV